MDEPELLGEYVRTASDAAFGELVQRHVNLVYTAARRQYAAGADDVTQAVFLVLAQRAGSIRDARALPGWLLSVTRHCAAAAQRAEGRRRVHERSFAAMQQVASAEQREGRWEDLAGRLDAAMATLRQTDRTAVVLRFFEDRPVAEVATALGISQEAAKKRLTRAISRLRGYFTRHGVTVPATSIGGLLAANALEAAPATTITTAMAATHATAVAGQALAIAKGAMWTMAWAKAKPIIAAGVALLLLGGGATVMTRHLMAQLPPPPPAPIAVRPAAPLEAEGPKAPDDPAYKTQPVAGIPADFPIAKGFPLALPGAIIASPVIADLDGNGKPVIVVPCAQRDLSNPLVHANANNRPLLFAVRADGTTVPGWPVSLGPQGRVGRRNAFGGWNSTPAVIPSKTGDRVAIIAPGGPSNPSTIIDAKRNLIPLRGGLDPASSPVLVDLTGKGDFDILTGRPHNSPTGGQSLPIFFRNGFAPCVGDAIGDGRLYLFHLFYTNKGTSFCDVGGFDALGKSLPGWPQLVDDPTWLGPVMGDISGTGKMSIVLGCGRHIHAWAFDGKPAPGCQTVQTGDKELNSVLIDNIMAVNARPTLADLDGDGKAEIILFDPERHALRAWYGDGKPFGKFPDGIIAELDAPAQGISAQGVSVVSLGEDPKIIDFFLGTVWIRLKPDGSVTATHMLPNDETPSVEWMQPTVCDLFGDGKASVLFGTSDGRLVVYNTGLAFHPERAQWPTAHHDFQHTACWTRPKATP